MRFHRVVCILLFSLANSLVARGVDTSAAISEARLATSTKLLSSDEFEGRGVGTKGIDKAADYIAAEFARLGLKTDLFDGGPFQKFPMTVRTDLGPKSKNRLVLVGPPEEGTEGPAKVDFELGKSFTPLAVGGSGNVAAPLVFVGYGITDKEQQVRRLRRDRREGQGRA